MLEAEDGPTGTEVTIERIRENHAMHPHHSRSVVDLDRLDLALGIALWILDVIIDGQEIALRRARHVEELAVVAQIRLS